MNNKLHERAKHRTHNLFSLDLSKTVCTDNLILLRLVWINPLFKCGLDYLKILVLFAYGSDLRPWFVSRFLSCLRVIYKHCKGMFSFSFWLFLHVLYKCCSLHPFAFFSLVLSVHPVTLQHPNILNLEVWVSSLIKYGQI